MPAPAAFEGEGEVVAANLFAIYEHGVTDALAEIQAKGGSPIYWDIDANRRNFYELTKAERARWTVFARNNAHDFAG